MRRPNLHLSTALLVVALLAAGCGGFIAPDDRTNPDGTATPSLPVENFSYPSGWAENGIIDHTAAVRTHYETTDGVSRKTRVVITDSDSNRTIVRTANTDAGTASLRFVDTTFDNDRHTYYDETGVYEYDRNAEEVTSVSQENWTMGEVATFEDDMFNRPLTNLQLRSPETLHTEGTTAVRYTVSGLAEPSRTPVNYASGHVIVSEDGFIVEFDIQKSNDEFTRRTRFTLSEYGTAEVTRPDWVPDE